MTILGHSVKTTTLGYIIAALLAIQPILTEPINWDSRHDLLKYAFRLVVAIAIAIFGRMAADSAQVKEVNKKVEANSLMIDMQLRDQDQVNKDQQQINRSIPPNEYNTRE